jgi:hypothetical protein
MTIHIRRREFIVTLQISGAILRDRNMPLICALRDFKPHYVCCGSKAEVTALYKLLRVGTCSAPRSGCRPGDSSWHHGTRRCRDQLRTNE